MVGKKKIKGETGNTGQELEYPGITEAGTKHVNVGESGRRAGPGVQEAGEYLRQSCVFLPWELGPPCDPALWV